jgi:hypothetical protein
MKTRVYFVNAPQLDGGTAQLWDAPWPWGDESATIDGAVAIFDMAPPQQFWMRARTGSGTYWMRSGKKDLSIGEVDENTGDWVTWYLLSDPVEIVQSPSDLSGAVPSLPITSGDVKVTGMSFSISGSRLVAKGEGEYIPFGWDIGFRYEFRLKPYRSPFNTERILNVETVDVDVWGKEGGLVGWLINLIIDIISEFMEDSIASQIETVIQERVDAEIADLLAKEKPPAGTTVTVQSVSLNPTTGLTVKAAGCVLFRDYCASVLGSGSIRLRPREQLKALRRLRETVLKGTPRGDAYIYTLRRHNAELVRLLINYPDLLAQVDTAVDSALRDCDRAKPNLSEEAADEIIRMLQMLADLGSTKMGIAARALIADVKGYAGQPLSQVFAKRPEAPKKQASKSRKKSPKRRR